MYKLKHNPGKVKTAILSSVILVLFGYIDYKTGIEISFAIFYLIPIAIAAWYLGRNTGVVFAVASACLWLLSELQLVERFSSPAIPYWNALVRFGFFIVVVYLINKIHSLQFMLEEKIEGRTTDLRNEILEREKTENELKFQSSKLSQLTMRLQTIREEENLIISREIHDELGQSLTAMKIEVNRMMKAHPDDEAIAVQLNQLSDSIDDTIKTIRKISTRLRPRLLDQLGFLSAVEWHINDFSSRTGIVCSLRVDDENFDLRMIDANALFRIIQESLTNIARHSKATSVIVSIETGIDDNLRVSIKDNGIGMPESALRKDNSLGIIGMNERARMLGGNLDIGTPPDGGTEVIVTVPFNQILQEND